MSWSDKIRRWRRVGLCSVLCVSLHGLAIAQTETETPTPPKKPAQAAAAPAGKSTQPTRTHAATKRTSSNTSARKSKSSHGRNRSRPVAKKRGQKTIDSARAREIQTALRGEQLTAPAAVAAAFAATTRAAVGIVTELNRQISELETSLDQHFETHPDADIYLSLPGLGVILGARVLGEFGDDPTRYTDAKSRKNYAGTSPLTIASGKKRAVLARYVRNRRLYDAIDQWAFCALSNSPGARLFYDQHRDAKETHHQALRALGNRLVGILHGCLRHHTRYDEQTAWAHRASSAA